MDGEAKKDTRPEGRVELQATMIGALARAQHIAVMAVDSGRYTGGILDTVNILGLDHYYMVLDEVPTQP